MMQTTARDAAASIKAAVIEPTFVPGERDKGLSTFRDMALTSKLGPDGVKKQVSTVVEKEINHAKEVQEKEKKNEKKAERSQTLARA